jgi:tRNA threonylcarbamoyladenosine biosynthesis protein TsaE
MSEEHFTVATPEEFESSITVILKKAAVLTDTAALITLTGDLGAGKTTFTQQLAKHLGITDRVVSPTFGIMKGYELDNHPLYDQLIHIDAYRIEDISEVGPLRLREVFQTPRTLICLEWPEQITEILPEEKVSVIIEIGEGEKRKITIKA